MRRIFSVTGPLLISRAHTTRADIPAELKAKLAQPASFPALQAESTATFKDMRPLPTASETDEHLRRRLLYQSRYRGMVEMDLILGAFAKHKLEAFNREQLIEYDTLLRQLDNDLFNWCVSGEKPPREVGDMKIWGSLMTFVDENRSDLVEFR